MNVLRMSTEKLRPPPPANVRVEEEMMILCVECTVYVSMDMTPIRGWWGVALGSP